MNKWYNTKHKTATGGVAMKKVLAVVKAKGDELTTITILEYDFNEGNSL
jgi:hypothetical protein